jgi:hypothetical protein
MQTMQPVVLRGRSGLAFGPEEFQPRVAAVQHELTRQGLDALVLYGDARDYAPVAWVTGFVPMLKWAVAVVAADADVELYLAAPGTRDLAAMGRLACVSAVYPIGALGGSLRRFGRVALAGGRRMRARQEAAVRAGAAVAGNGDALLAGLTAKLSVAELQLLEAAAHVAEDAAGRVVQMWRHGAGANPALLAGDLRARELGAHDVRLLWSADGGRGLRPPPAPAAVRPDPFAFYLAVELGGYWGEAFRTPGAPADAEPAAHGIVAPTARLWLSIEESHDEPLRPGVYSIRSATTSGAVTSKTVRVR